MNRPIQNVVGYYSPSALHFSQVPLEVEVEVETHRRKEKKVGRDPPPSRRIFSGDDITLHPRSTQRVSRKKS